MRKVDDGKKEKKRKKEKEKKREKKRMAFLVATTSLTTAGTPHARANFCIPIKVVPKYPTNY